MLAQERRAARREPLAVKLCRPAGKFVASGRRMVDLLEEAARLDLLHRGDLVDTVDLAHRDAIFLALPENLFAAVRGGPAADLDPELVDARLAVRAGLEPRGVNARHFHQLFDLNVGSGGRRYVAVGGFERAVGGPGGVAI